MTKPRTKTSRAQTPAAKPAEPSGEAMFDDGASPVDQADQAGEAVPETLPIEAPGAVAPEEVQGGPAWLEVLKEQATDAEEDGEQLFDKVFGEDEEPAPRAQEPDLEPAESSDRFEIVMLGQVKGLLGMVPLEAVQAILGEPALERVELLRSSESIHDLQRRMRVSDGRCAPMIFTESAGDPPVLFSGIDSYAAALNLGLRNISVITIAPTDASAAQSWVSQQQAKPPSPDDDMLFRVRSSASLA